MTTPELLPRQPAPIPLCLDGWTCGRCGSTWSYYFHECPDCDAISDGLTIAAAIREGRNG